MSITVPVMVGNSFTLVSDGNAGSFIHNTIYSSNFYFQPPGFCKQDIHVRQRRNVLRTSSVFMLNISVCLSRHKPAR